ncbi:MULTISPECIES: serine hydrolase [unclassified Roseovarius]|uniref:serine hydrolase domain-containing protein n=1 Tax=unclassified Roseovarius TaxID=2614913 RepID=UPI00273E9EE3|nr:MULTISPECIES: serine hydrolase domain-containing protein [unclassified Roseovarius]
MTLSSRVLSLFAGVILTLAATAAKPDIVDTMQGLLDASSIPAVGFAIVEDGDVTQLSLLSKTGDVPVTSSFRAGSLSKTATSLMILSLVEDGLVALDTPIADVLPDAPIENPWENEAPLRLVHLLEQTSGLPGTSYADYAQASPDYSPTAYLGSKTHRLRWPPGRYFSYANGNHTLAAAVAEAVTGQDFDTLMRERVLDPLGMAATSFDLTDERVQDLLESFSTDGSPEAIWHLSVRPSGAMTGPISDMAKLLRFLATGDGVDQPVSSEMLLRMRTPQSSLVAQDGYRDIYGLGLFSFSAAGRAFWGHWGRIDGFQTTLGTLPEEGAGFVLMANGADRRAFHEIREALAAHVAERAGAADPVNPEAQVEFDAAPYLGWWVPFTDDSVLRTWISEMAGLTQISSDNAGSQLIARSILGGAVTLIPVSKTRFRQDGFATATHVFSRTPEGEIVMLGDQQLTYRQIPAAQAHLMRFGLLYVLTSIVAALLVGLFVCIQLLRGRRAAYYRPAAYLGGSAVFLAGFCVLFVVWGMIGSLAELDMLAIPSLRSGILAMLSLAWPFCLACGIRALCRSNREISKPAKVLLWISVTGLLVAAVYLAFNGWIPLLTWGAE